MNILICGLGLIGGSFAKAIKEKTTHTVIGLDTDGNVTAAALECGAVDQIATENDYAVCDFVILALYPSAAIAFVRENIAKFKPKTVLLDTCGIKTEVCEQIGALTKGTTIRFIGGHPMAGTENSGFFASSPDMFNKASMILCPEYCGDDKAVITASELAESIGFARIVISDCKKHDAIIAFTSQLAHIVSSAYIQGKYATEYEGFSAGSFKDMTRVAKLNPTMWTELFFENGKNLSEVTGELIENLQKYKDALDKSDRKAMYDLLYRGNERKLLTEKL